MAKYIDVEKLIAYINENRCLVENLSRKALEDNHSELYLQFEQMKEDYSEFLYLITSLQKDLDVIKLTFKGGTYRINGEEKTFKGGTAKVAILELIPNDEDK